MDWKNFDMDKMMDSMDNHIEKMIKENEEKRKNNLAFFQSEEFYLIYDKIKNSLKELNIINSDDFHYQRETMEKYQLNEDDFFSFYNAVREKVFVMTDPEADFDTDFFYYKELQLGSIWGQGAIYSIRLNENKQNTNGLFSKEYTESVFDSEELKEKEETRTEHSSIINIEASSVSSGVGLMENFEFAYTCSHCFEENEFKFTPGTSLSDIITLDTVCPHCKEKNELKIETKLTATLIVK